MYREIQREVAVYLMNAGVERQKKDNRRNVGNYKKRIPEPWKLSQFSSESKAHRDTQRIHIYIHIIRDINTCMNEKACSYMKPSGRCRVESTEASYLSVCSSITFLRTFLRGDVELSSTTSLAVNIHIYMCISSYLKRDLWNR